MRKVLPVTWLLCILFCCCSCKSEPRGYDPFLDAVDGEVFYVGDQHGTFSTPNPEIKSRSSASIVTFEAFSLFDKVAAHICLVQVKSVRDLETYEETVERSYGPYDRYSYGSVVELEIIKVFMDDRENPLKPKEIIRAYSSNSSKDAQGFPVLQEGSAYYVVLTEMNYWTYRLFNIPEEQSKLNYMKAMGGYLIGSPHYCKWQLHDDGMVEYPAEMFDIGEVYWKGGDYTYRLASQDEFEAALQKVIQENEEARIKKNKEYYQFLKDYYPGD